MMPLLHLYGCAVGIFGGYLVSITTLETSHRRVSWTSFAALWPALSSPLALAKSVAFGALVTMAGCQIGLNAGRSADDVGHAATEVVVTGIVGVIALDAVFAVCTNALKI